MEFHSPPLSGPGHIAKNAPVQELLVCQFYTSSPFQPNTRTFFNNIHNFGTDLALFHCNVTNSTRITTHDVLPKFISTEQSMK